MAAVPKEAVLAVLKQLSHDIRDLDIGTSVDRHQKLPVVQFLRDYVSANKPVVLTSVVSHWPAYTNWTDNYLCSVAGDTEVTVALTPNGRADAITPLPGGGGAGLSGNSSQTTSPSPSSSSPTAAGGAAEAEVGAGGGADGAGERHDAAANGRGAASGGVDGGSSGCSPGCGAAPAKCFALPHQVKMPLRDFLKLLRSSRQPQAPANGTSTHAGGASRSAAEPAGQAGAARAGAGAGAGAPGSSGVVPYLQYQNSSLTAEVPQLLGDVDLLLSWATQAFGGLPEAVNLWIGDERSVTSWHKDPFENIYAVVAGTKTFTLLPPADLYRMRLKQYSQATYRPTSGAAEDSCTEEGVEGLASGAVPLAPALDERGEQVLWSSVPPLPDLHAALKQGPGSPAAAEAAAAIDLFGDPALPPPLRVTVKAGEALYLPAMWWHHVEQEPDESGRAIAVNYWYDMKWDVKQAYLSAVERLAEVLGLNEPPPPPPPPRSDLSESAQLRPPYTSTRAFG